MGPADLADPGLVVHVFVAASGPGAQENVRRLRAVWDELGARLDMPPATVGRVEVRTGAGEPLRQAVWRSEHDICCLSVALTGGTWAELAALWRDCASAAGDDLAGWALGVCLVFLAYPRTPSDQRLTSAVLAALPGTYSRARVSTSVGIAVWEVGFDREDRVERTFAALAPRELEASLDAWAWTRGDDEMAPLSRHLMHAAKIRYELRVYARGDAFRAARDRVSEQVEAMLSALRANSVPSARLELAERQAAGAGLIWAATRLREMRRTVEIARDNMREALLADDRAVACWFLSRLDDDLDYADAVRERAREVSAVADLVIRERLQCRAEDSERRWARFGVLEAAVIGTLIMMLTAVQALSYRVPVRDAAKPYIVGGLGLVAFGLAAFGFLRWRRQR
jgi:hypothetical protein